MFRYLIATLVLAGAGLSVQAQEAAYGVDCSFPIHNKEFRCGDLLGDRKQVYDDFMAGCREAYGKKGVRCDSTENDRIEMSLRQPAGMVNYTKTGFMKIRAPEELRNLIAAHWERNKDAKTQEKWPVGNVYTNHWKAPTYMVSVEDQGLRGGGYALKQKIWDAAQSTIENWTGMELKPTSMYGIRVYTEGAILSPHVDRMPLVSSCIINVAQDVDEPWPLEVYDRAGNAVNVTMEPGDMVLYESHSLLHGRPFELKGRYYANIFIHFEPTGRPLHDDSNDYLNNLDDFLPPYIVPGSAEVDKWTKQNPHGWRRPSPSAPIQQINSPEGHHAAALGDVEHLAKIASKSRRSLNAKDQNGWQPIHEAARAGHKDAVELLLKHGVKVNARTGKTEKGSSPLNIALEYLSEDHPVARYLMSVGAENIESEL